MSEEAKVKKYYDYASVGKRTKQTAYFVEQHDKATMLKLVLSKIEKKQVVIVTKSKLTADDLKNYLNDEKIVSTAIHGNYRPEKCAEAATAFNASEINTLITTESILVSLELQNVGVIINFDMPILGNNYFTRLNLVDEVGEAISFIKSDEEKLVQNIEYLMKDEIQELEMEGFEVTPEPIKRKKSKDEKRKKPRHRKMKSKKNAKEDKELDD